MLCLFKISNREVLLFNLVADRHPIFEQKLGFKQCPGANCFGTEIVNLFLIFHLIFFKYSSMLTMKAIQNHPTALAIN